MTLLHGAAGTNVATLTVMAAAFQRRRPWVAIRAWTWKHVRALDGRLTDGAERVVGAGWVAPARFRTKKATDDSKSKTIFARAIRQSWISRQQS